MKLSILDATGHSVIAASEKDLTPEDRTGHCQILGSDEAVEARFKEIMQKGMGQTAVAISPTGKQRAVTAAESILSEQEVLVIPQFVGG